MPASLTRPLLLLALMSFLTGIMYPMLVTALAAVLTPEAADGSLILRNGTPVGSRLIGQQWHDDRYFHGRPSACSYGTLPATGSNLAPTSVALHDAVAGRLRDIRAENHCDSTVAVPADMLTTSASGLDPDISPEAAFLQAPRIAAARGFDLRRSELLDALIWSLIRNPEFGVLGQPRVNVLVLNVALDTLQ